MTNDPDIQTNEGPLLPWYIIAPVAIICAIVLIALAVLGPLGLGKIVYLTSQSGEWQTAGNDLANLVLIVPLLLIGAALEVMKRPASKYFLVLTPLTIMYTGLSVGIGQEWGNPNYSGNADQYFWLFLALITGGLVLLIGVLPRFSRADAPDIPKKRLRALFLVTALFLALFALMWTTQVVEVQMNGDLPDGSYSSTPTVFWTIRYLDLGVVIPIGFLSLAFLITNPKRAFHLVLLFFGFLMTLGTAVNTMALVMYINDDPSLSAAAVGIFAVLGAVAYIMFYMLVKDKVRQWMSARSSA